MRAILISLFALLFASPAVAVDHSPWTLFLASYVQPHEDGVNRVAYGDVKAQDRQLLEDYLNALQAADPAAMTDAQQMAFWINLYNALTIKVILDHYPVDSIRQIKNGLFSFGPWKVKRIVVQGEQLSLDEIEHQKLRARFKDPRIHYAVNCASIGCPNLAARAYTADRLEAMLDEGARAYINHPRGVQISPNGPGGKLVASEIYNWFARDFGATDAERIAHFKKYAAPELKQALGGFSKIHRYEYDWSLNGTD